MNHKNRIRIMERAVLVLMLTAMPSASPAQFLVSPQPNDVYKEFATVMGGDDWRVTDPNIDLNQYPQAGDFLPNPVLSLSIDDLSGATRAEAVINVWGGHLGTYGRKFRFNGNSWINIPDFGSGNGIPGGHDGLNYITQSDYVLPVPLGDLVQGSNSFEGTNAGQTGPYAFGWGQFGWYSMIIRVYYDGNKTHSTGSITSPSSGGTFGENPVVTASVSGGTDRVDFLAYYDGYDTDGDGVWQEYHHDYSPTVGQSAPMIKNHVGTATGGSWQTTWNTQFVPDQPSGSIKLLARIRNSNGVWFVSPEVTGLTLQRSGSYVRLYKPQDMPERAWAREGDEIIIHVDIPGGDNVANATQAVGFVRTWNGIDGAQEPGDYNYRKFNNWTDGAYGGNHAYSFDIRNLPLSELRSGSNTFTFFATNVLHHGMEILWPGPGLVVRYGGGATNVAPSITTHPSDQSAVLGGTATFSVGATGTPPLTYQWQKNNSDIGGANGASYTTPPVVSGDNGATFRCLVHNAYGDATSNSATLTIGATSAPTINTHPLDQTVQAGETATFSVGASGDPPISYQWQKNNGDISGATGTSYTTPATAHADSGALFRCVVSNNGGSTNSNAARLTVISPASPVINRNPVDQLVGVGRTATFTVGATGPGTLTYHWQKNGATIDGATSSSYTTPATVLSDSGTVYRCVAANSSDSATSIGAILRVTTGSVSILSNPGFEQGTTSWNFFTNGIGDYTVVPAGPNNPHAVQINIVQEGANVQLNQSGFTLEAGAEYQLFFRAFCSSGHDVAVSVQKNDAPYSPYGLSSFLFDVDTSWKDFSRQFTASGFTGVTTDTRVMFFLAPYDSSNDNFYFDDVVLARVSSIAPPGIATHPANATIPEGETAMFEIVPSGTPPFSYQWQKNDIDIEGGTGASYTTPAATAGDDGATFRCIVRNPLGEATSNPSTLNVTTTGVKGGQHPSSFVLDQNYPNPFNPSTVIRYGLPLSSHVRLTVYDLLGKEVSTLVNSMRSPGYYEVTFNASGLTSGIYLYRIEAGDFVQTLKLLLLK